MFDLHSSKYGVTRSRVESGMLRLQGAYGTCANVYNDEEGVAPHSHTPFPQATPSLFIAYDNV